ncbi:MAG: biotin transporter BioY [Lactobacillus sp.]|nr:biotin transporter BioY [Lactobacillus sp.]MCI2032909.1 biotin transporter BioY [Lactobacillus sp.]
MGKDHALKELLQAAMICALLIILGLFPGIPLGIIPVAIVLQNLGVMLAGELLPPRYATLAVVVFLLLVALGLPLLSGGRGGAASFVGPTGGYLLGWLLAPALNGWLLGVTQAPQRAWWVEFLVAATTMVVIVDIIGALFLAMQAHMPLVAALLSNLAFIPGDLLKVALAVTIARRLRRVVH